MAYQKYYPNGWKSGEVGATPITPEALNNMENGIAAAVRTEDIVDNLNSTAANQPLSAKQGKALHEEIQQSTANIGTVYTGTGSVSSVTTGTYTEVLSVSVPAGKYIVIRGCDFGSNATGMRRVGVDNGSGRADFANTQAVSGFDTVLQHIQYANYSSQTNIKCVVYQNSGTTLNIWPYMYAIRIA